MARRGRNNPRGRRSRGGSVGDGLATRHSDWRVGGNYIDSAGTQQVGGSWNGGPYTLPVTSAFAFQAVVLPIAAPASNSPPNVGALKCDEVQGSIFLNNPSAAGLYIVGVGIYVSFYNSVAGTWSIRRPDLAPDAGEDDYLFMKVFQMVLQTNASATVPFSLEIPLAIPHAVYLGGGEALHVGLGNNQLTGTIAVIPYFRTRISAIA